MSAQAVWRAAVSPSLWFNDDFPELGRDVKLAQCLGEAHLTGFEGIEIGARFPQHPQALVEALGLCGLSAVGGQFDTRLIKNGLGEERPAFESRLAYLAQAGCTVMIVTEVTGEIYSRREGALFGPSLPSLPPEKWKKLAEELDEMADTAEASGLKLAYRPRLGTLVQDKESIDKIISRSQKIFLALDTGHLEVADVSAESLVSEYKNRIGHVQLKKIRRDVMREMGAGKIPYCDAVRRGLFAPPGEGKDSFSRLFSALLDAEYRGWISAAAEQDPVSHDPRKAATKARAYLKTNAEI
jgi:inosose dehydratase